MVTLEDLEGSVQLLVMNDYDKFRPLLEAEQGHSRHRRSQHRRGQAEDFSAGNHAAGGRAEEIHEAGSSAPAHGAFAAGRPGERRANSSPRIPANARCSCASCGRKAGRFLSRRTRRFGVTPSLELEHAANRLFGEKTYYANVDTSLPENASAAVGKRKTATATATNEIMKTRREFFKSAAALGVLGAAGLPLRRGGNAQSIPCCPADDRRYWVSVTEKIARPVLENLARRELKKKMPVEEKPGAEPRKLHAS